MVKDGFLGRVRQLLGSIADEFRETGDIPSRETSGLARAQAAIREQLGLLLVERRRIEKERAAATQELEALMGKATFAVSAAREDLARAALTHRNALEERLAQLEDDHAHALAGIAALEDAAVSLSGTQQGSAGSGMIATQLAELDRLLRSHESSREKED
jgi:phage shock protein A